MLEELKLAAKPQRKSVEAEAKKAEERAFNRSYRQTRKDIAKAEGTAAGIAAAKGVDAPSSAVEAARQRALGGNTKATPAPTEAKAKPAVDDQRFVEVPARGRTYRVPDPQWYEASQEQREQLMDAVDAEDRKQADDNLSLRVSNELLGLRDKDSARIGALEGQLTTLLGVVEALQRRLDQRDNQLEVSKSEALLEQQAAIADAVLNAAAVETSLRNQTVASQAAHDQQAIESRAQLEAQATAIDALRGTVSSTTQLMAERGNAVVDQLATAESRQARLGVQLTELEGQADAIGNPITRPEIQALVTDAVTAGMEGTAARFGGCSG